MGAEHSKESEATATIAQNGSSAARCVTKGLEEVSSEEPQETHHKVLKSSADSDQSVSREAALKSSTHIVEEKSAKEQEPVKHLSDEASVIGPEQEKETAWKIIEAEDTNKMNQFSQHVTIGSDYEAAIECLFALKSDFGASCAKWPSNASAMNDFIKMHAKGKSSLAYWITHGKQKKHFNRKPGIIRKRLVKELVSNGIVSVDKGTFHWRQQETDDILASPLSVSLPHVFESKGSNGTNIHKMAGISFVDTPGQLQSLKEEKLGMQPPGLFGNDVVAIDCEGVPEDLFLIQIGTPSITYVFDCVKLGPKIVCDFLQGILTDEGVTKLFHDLHNDAAALASIGGIREMKGTLDTQIAMEHLTGDTLFGFNRVLEQLGASRHMSKNIMKRQMKNKNLFSQRPLPQDVLQYAVDDARLLAEACESLRKRLGDDWEAVQLASDMRARSAAANGGKRSICFDVPNSYAIASYELLYVTRPDDMMAPSPLRVSNETDTLLKMLPEDLVDALHESTQRLSDVVLDKGRRPHAWIGGERLLLGADDRFVEQNEVNAVVEQLGGFGSDNRAGLERQLHRISAIRNRESQIIGLTLRFGRHVSGNTGIISDLLFGDPAKSILFLGEPGAGKTTVVREVTRLLAERCNVCIVDTSNEIAGDGDIPHPCVGFARRMMVPSLDRQSAVMIECVQNHTPEVMIIDEIGRPTEVEAARTCKNRGVRLIASAHGDLRKLIKNPKLRGLIGGVETVTLGDMQAKAEAKKHPGSPIQKTKAERAGPPTFDILVELKRGAHHEWRIVLESGDAVDRVLRGEEYKAQRRTRDPDTGAVYLDLEMA